MISLNIQRAYGDPFSLGLYVLNYANHNHLPNRSPSTHATVTSYTSLRADFSYLSEVSHGVEPLDQTHLSVT